MLKNDFKTNTIQKQNKKEEFGPLLGLAIFLTGLITLNSFLLPRFADYQGNFELFNFGTTTLLDGSWLMLGVLVLIFAGLIKRAFEMQNELDEVL